MKEWTLVLTVPDDFTEGFIHTDEPCTVQLHFMPDDRLVTASVDTSFVR